MARACLRAWPALALGWAVFVCAPAFATLVNGDFEDPNMGNPDVSLSMPSWIEMEDGAQKSSPGPNSSVGIVRPLPPHPLGTEPFGSGNWGFIQLANQAATEGQFYQSLGVVEANTQYTIRFDVSNIDSVNLGIFNPIDVRDADTLVQVYFTVGNSAPSFASHVGGFWESMLDDIGPENAIVFDRELVFTAIPSQVGQNLNIVFRAARPAGASVYPSEVWFDNVRLEIQTSVVPEPASYSLAALGVASVGAFGASRRLIRRRAG